MTVIKTNHALIDFWKIPSDLVSFDDGRINSTNKRLVVSMPAEDNRAKPALYQWGEASLFATLRGHISNSSDISTAISVDPISRTVSLPFNFDQAVNNLLMEEYLTQESDQFLVSHARRLYYKIKPLLPRSIQVLIRQNAVGYMGQREFPNWELDVSVDLLQRNLIAKLIEILPAHSIPMISFWPQGANMCLLLTHDVETYEGMTNILNIVNIEKKHGFRSAWNFVPERYAIDHEILRELQADGFEIGVHGCYHDGRLFESYKLFLQRASKINDYLKLWDSVGFRSESNLRKLDWISKHIQAEYDSSCVSTEWYGAQPGGCCTAFPFIHKGVVELPTTLQQDFTLLEILKLTPQENLTHWIKSVKSIKKLNGLVMINVHPDYMISRERLELYEQFLQYMKSETNCWQALPKEVARWWVDRINSELSNSNGRWYIDGPASEDGVVMHVNLEADGLRIQATHPEDRQRNISSKLILQESV